MIFKKKVKNIFTNTCLVRKLTLSLKYRKRETHTNNKTMKEGTKFENGDQMFHLNCGEMATVAQDPNGKWGFETNKGYCTWEYTEFGTKKEAVSELREYDKRAMTDK